MNSEMLDMWDALKDAKYRRTLEELSSVLEEKRSDFDAAMRGVLNIVSGTMHAEAGTLWQFSRQDGLIRPKASYGGSDLADIYLVPGEGVAGQVIKNAVPEIISDCQKDARWAGKVDLNTEFCTRSMLCVPLCGSDGAAFGCIQLINKTDGYLFDEKDMQFAMQLAAVAAQQCEKYGIVAKGGGRTGDERRTFSSIFLARSQKSMEAGLRECAEFASLGVRDQEEVLEHACAIWRVFDRRNRQMENKKFRLFGD